jgi:hypothetical protein
MGYTFRPEGGGEEDAMEGEFPERSVTYVSERTFNNFQNCRESEGFQKDLHSRRRYRLR